MQISRLLWEQMIHLWKQNAALLDHTAGTEIKIQLVGVPFTPGLNVVLADVPPIAAGISPTNIEVFDADPEEFTDPLTTDRVVEFAANGFPMIVHGSGGGLAGNIYGTRLVTNDGLTLLATQLLDPPLTFSAKAYDGGEIPRIQFRFPPTMVR